MALHPPIENVPNRDNADNRSGIANGLQDELNGMSYPSLSTAYRQALSNTQTPGKVDGANRDQIGAGAAGKDGEPGKTTEPGKTIEPGKTAGQCAESPDYKEIIDTAAAMMFDPSPLGDVAKLE